MRSQASVSLVGSVVGSEFRPTAKGFPVLRVTVAGNALNRSGDRSIPYYQQVRVLGQLAEAYRERLRPGVPVIVDGALRQRMYETAAGEKRSDVSVTVQAIGVMGGEHETVADARGNVRLARGKNEVQLVGNVTRDPEVRVTPNGHSVTRFSVAVNGNRDEVSFFEVTAWDELADQAGALRKGARVMVTGAIYTDSWDDATSGQKRYATRVDAHTLTALERGGALPVP